MKRQELPKAPIQIQRDELAAKVANLQGLLVDKDKQIAALQSELQLKNKTLADKDSAINALQTELQLKNKTLENQHGTITSLENDLLQKKNEIEELGNRLYLIENDVIILGEGELDGGN